MGVNFSEMAAQLLHLGHTHEQNPRLHQVGSCQNAEGSVLMYQNFLGHRMGIGIGHEVFAKLRVDVVGPFLCVQYVKTDGHAVCQLVRVVWVHQYAHGRSQVIHAVEFAL